MGDNRMTPISRACSQWGEGQVDISGWDLHLENEDSRAARGLIKSKSTGLGAKAVS